VAGNSRALWRVLDPASGPHPISSAVCRQQCALEVRAEFYKGSSSVSPRWSSVTEGPDDLHGVMGEAQGSTGPNLVRAFRQG
jgi:hypothetical protein